jgi:hypothetical protein
VSIVPHKSHSIQWYKDNLKGDTFKELESQKNGKHDKKLSYEDLQLAADGKGKNGTSKKAQEVAWGILYADWGAVGDKLFGKNYSKTKIKEKNVGKKLDAKG